MYLTARPGGRWAGPWVRHGLLPLVTTLYSGVVGASAQRFPSLPSDRPTTTTDTYRLEWRSG